MKSGVTVKVKRNDLPEISAKLHGKCVEIVAKSSYDLEGEIKRNVQQKHIIDTGALLNSTQVQRFEDDGLTSYTGPGVDYAIYQEFGTRYQPARPHVQPAFDWVSPRFLKALRSVFKK